ncbi:MAG: YbaK/EbsC family protein [Bryobacteraceae bacterium]|nr:YbaK/EbsC family protein [Bryobacteraceae bacterium]
MALLPALQKLLTDSQVGYTHHVHPLAFTAREVAAAEHIPPREVAKTIVYFGDHGYGMAVLPGDFVVDLNELRAALDLTRARLATERELAGLFPQCELGAMPPVGVMFGMPVYVDSSLTRNQTIAFNGGTHRDVVILRYADFEKLVQPRVMQFARFVTR